MTTIGVDAFQLSLFCASAVHSMQMQDQVQGTTAWGAVSDHRCTYRIYCVRRTAYCRPVVALLRASDA